MNTLIDNCNCHKIANLNSNIVHLNKNLVCTFYCNSHMRQLKMHPVFVKNQSDHITKIVKNKVKNLPENYNNVVHCNENYPYLVYTP